MKENLEDADFVAAFELVWTILLAASFNILFVETMFRVVDAESFEDTGVVVLPRCLKLILRELGRNVE